MIYGSSSIIKSMIWPNSPKFILEEKVCKHLIYVLGVLYPVAGKEATKEFFSLHREDVLKQMGPKLCIGTVEGNIVK